MKSSPFIGQSVAEMPPSVFATLPEGTRLVMEGQPDLTRKGAHGWRPDHGEVVMAGNVHGFYRIAALPGSAPVESPRPGTALGELTEAQILVLPVGTVVAHREGDRDSFRCVTPGYWVDQRVGSVTVLRPSELHREMLIVEAPPALPSVTPEPPPTPGTGDMWAEILQKLPPILEPLRPHLVARREMGLQKYGVPLQRDNGRDAKVDEAQEHLDAAVYRWAWAGDDGQTWNSLSMAGSLLGVFAERPEVPDPHEGKRVPVLQTLGEIEAVLDTFGVPTMGPEGERLSLAERVRRPFVEVEGLRSKGAWMSGTLDEIEAVLNATGDSPTDQGRPLKLVERVRCGLAYRDERLAAAQSWPRAYAGTGGPKGASLSPAATRLLNVLARNDDPVIQVVADELRKELLGKQGG